MPKEIRDEIKAYEDIIKEFPNDKRVNIKEIEVTNDPNKTRLLQNVETDIEPDKDGSSCSV